MVKLCESGVGKEWWGRDQTRGKYFWIELDDSYFDYGRHVCVCAPTL